MNEIEDAVNGVEKAVNGVTALGTIIMHIVTSLQLFLKESEPEQKHMAE